MWGNIIMRMFIKTVFVNLFSVVYLLHTAFAHGAQQFNQEDWKFSDDGVKIIQDGNQDVLQIANGKMTLLAEEFENGTIEFEMKTEGQRAFLFASFRESGNQYEEVYVRTHKSNAPDALQYTPVFQGRSAWQIYHGDKGTSAATIPANEWIKVKIAVSENVLDMTLGNGTAPQLSGILLTGAKQSGTISFRGLIPRNSPATYSALLRNIKITPLQTNPQSRLPIASLSDTFIKELRVSDAFDASKEPIDRLPESISDKTWSKVTAQHDGIFEFLRWREIPKGMRSYAVVAETNLFAEHAMMCQVNIGFSDAVSVLLNDKILAHADMSYRYDNNRQQGVLHTNQISVFLPLNEGDNKLQMVVADSFGGWGLQTQLMNCEGVKASI